MVVDPGQQANAGHVRSATFVAVAAQCCCTCWDWSLVAARYVLSTGLDPEYCNGTYPHPTA